MNLTEEFDKQSQNLIHKNYHKISGLSESEFINLLMPLKTNVEKLDLPDIDFEKGYLPFVIVIKSKLVPTTKAMSVVDKNGKNGITKLNPLLSSDFETIKSISIPETMAYLLVDIDRGKETLNVRPEDALVSILAANRSPLTIDEGIAIITQFPEFLIKNNCFSLLASRHNGDQRVPAIWINANNNPNLGWCWDRNPHTWLGFASCKERLS